MRNSKSLIIFAALFVVSLALFPFVSVAQTSPVRARVTQPVDVQTLVTLRGNVHPWARPEFDQGVAPDDLPLNRILLVLQRGADQESALRHLLDNQQVKSSPQFHQWLTPEQFGQQFGPADSDLQAVTDWLAGQGFQVSKVSAGRTVIEFSGTAGLVRQALGTEIHKFALNNQAYWANSSDPQIPAALAPVVAGFASLNNFPLKHFSHSLGTLRRSKATGALTPLFTVSESSGPLYLVGPADFATIYNLLPLWNTGTDGAGQTIAVVAQTNINIQDARDFRSMFGLPANDPNIILNGPDPGINSEETEADLDVQWAGAVARGATIDLVVSASTATSYGINLSALYAIDNNLAPVLSVSYGEWEGSLGTLNYFYGNLWEQAAAQGITVVVSAGDNGSGECDITYDENSLVCGVGVNGLASTPFNVAVGGTDFDDASNPLAYWNPTNDSLTQSSAKSYIPESTWNDSCARSGVLTDCASITISGADITAGGGGPSNCVTSSGTGLGITCSGGYPKPSWQTGPGVPNDQARDLPDVSMFAGYGLNNSSYVICQRDANFGQATVNSCDLNAPYADFLTAGGTSTAAQVFAGILALVNQVHGRQGNANYVLYPLAAAANTANNGAYCNSSLLPASSAACLFYDTTKGNNSVACKGGTLDCTNTNSADGQFGMIVSGNPPTAAWTAASGYDLATGLGSVNIANLVTNWTSTFTPSTTQLHLAPANLTHGQPVTFSIHVNSSGGTPAGDVSLIAQTSSTQSTGIGSFTLTNGSYSGSTVLLPGGSYNVTAHYAGNGTFGASDSTPPIPVTVGKENSQSTLALLPGTQAYSATTVPYGSAFLSVNVADSSHTTCVPSSTSVSSACPSGTLTVTPSPTVPGAPSGTYSLNNEGALEIQPLELSPGSYDLMANYAGDNSFNPSASNTRPVTITAAPTWISLYVPSSSIGGVYVNSTISTESDGVAPTGNVQVLNNNVVMATVAIQANTYSRAGTGPANASIYYWVALPVGTDSLTVQYSGDDNYAGSTSAASTTTITLADFSLSANPSALTLAAPGQSGTATITVNPTNGFTGTVSFTCLPTYSAPGVSCAVSPQNFNVAGASPAAATLTVFTSAAPSLAPPAARPRIRPSSPPRVKWIGWLAGLLVVGALLGLPRIRWRPALARTGRSACATVTQPLLARHVAQALLPVHLKVSRPRLGVLYKFPARASWLLAGALLVAGIWVACGGGGGGGGGSSSAGWAIESLSTTDVPFGQQPVGTPTSPTQVTLGNHGNAPLNISSMALGGQNPGDFAQTNNCGSSVAAGGECLINLTFTPSAAGVRSALLTINNNEASGPQFINLSGTGVPPTVSVSPASLTFGLQTVGTTSAPQYVTIANTGTVGATVYGYSFTGPDVQDFSFSSGLSSGGLWPGIHWTLGLVFTPQGGGTRTASLVFNDNAAGAPQTVSLTGTAPLVATPPGTYSLDVRGISGSDTHDVYVFVTVQ